MRIPSGPFGDFIRTLLFGMVAIPVYFLALGKVTAVDAFTSSFVVIVFAAIIPFGNRISGPYSKRLPFVAGVLLNTVVMCLAIAIAIVVGVWLSAAISV